MPIPASKWHHGVIVFLFNNTVRKNMSFKSGLTHRLALPTVLLCLGLSLGTTPSWADVTIASVTSPDKTLHVEVQLASDGRLAYAVNRRGKSVIAPSHLGFLLTNAAQLDAGFSLDSQSTTLHGAISKLVSASIFTALPLLKSW